MSEPVARISRKEALKNTSITIQFWDAIPLINSDEFEVTEAVDQKA